MYLAMALAALGAWLGFANPLAHLPAAVLLLPGALAWIGLNATRGKEAFRLGWLAGLAAYSGGLYWIALPVHDYGPLPWVLAVPCPMLLGAYVGLFAGLFALGLHCLGRRLPWPLLGLLACGLWGGLEEVRNAAFTGFPWLSLASALGPWPFAIQGASILGAYGLAGVLAASATLALRGPGLSAPRLAAAALLALLAAFGLWQERQPMATTGTARVALIQGNIDQSLKWDKAYQDQTLRRYLDLTAREAAAGPLDLAVWPETAMPFFFQETDRHSDAVRDQARDLGVPILAGAPAYTPRTGKDGKPAFLMHNRAYLVGRQGLTLGQYDKEHLVPFGEYVPLQDILFFVSRMVQGVGDFAPGREQDPMAAGGLSLGALICYETIFPELAQDRVARGANLLANLTNDAWFGRSSAPLQHLHLSVMRAVEQGRFVVRAANTGISAIIDARGHILARTELYSTTALSAEVGLISETTPFHRARPWLMAALALAVLGPAAYSLRRERH